MKVTVTLDTDQWHEVQMAILDRMMKREHTRPILEPIEDIIDTAVIEQTQGE